MRIGVPREIQAGETRVALTPHLVPLLTRDGHEVMIESGAGVSARFPDALYSSAGAMIASEVQALYAQADVIFKVQAPGFNASLQRHEAELLPDGASLIGLLAPLAHLDVMRSLARRRITSYSLEYLPRLSRAQNMDALTSMATVAGYKAVLLAADRLAKMMPLLMTAAGTVAPANVLVLGVGVAGLQAIATAKRLGARVRAFDPRPPVREQVESLGAEFLAMDLPAGAETTGGYAREQSEAFLARERETIAANLPSADVVICSAQVFGKRAPLLITSDMARQMRPGSALVDLAAEQGGNCEATLPGQEAVRDGVLIIGTTNLPALVPTDASRLYAGNVVNFFRYLYPRSSGAQTGPGSGDEIVAGTCITRDGAIVNPAIRAAMHEGVVPLLRAEGVPS